MALTSDEINFLIYRYLRESGFEHSAYAFGHESYIYKSSLESSSIPPGALISFVQKGLQYAEIEAHINDDGTETICEESFSLMKKHTCKTRATKRKIFDAFDALDADYGQLEIDEARMLRTPLDATKGDHIGSSGMRNMAVCLLWHPHVPVEKSKRGNPLADQQQSTLLTAMADGKIKIWEWRDEPDEEDEAMPQAGASADATNAATKQPFQRGYVCVRTIVSPLLASSASPSAAAAASSTDATTTSAAASSTTTSPDTKTEDATMQDTLPGEPAPAVPAAASEAPAAAAAATSSSPAPSSADDTTNKRQKLADGSAALAPNGIVDACADSKHATTDCHVHTNQSVVAVDWHPRGVSFAAASYTGVASLWSPKGVLLHTLSLHTGPITALKFNKSGSLLLTASVDHTVAIWDTETGLLRKQWHLHTGPVLDIEWAPLFVPSSNKSRSNDSAAQQSTDPDNQYLFATCGTDGNIFVVDVRDESDSTPESVAAAAAALAALPPAAAAATPSVGRFEPRMLQGHEGEVNSVSWDPTGTLLLSSSDDCTVKVWNALTGDILHDLIDHSREVLTARWSGTGPCTDFHKFPLFIATGSTDTTVKLFDPTSGHCLHTLTQHTHPVSQVAFAPRQQLLATASHERVFIWSLSTGTMLKTFKNLGDPLNQTPNHIPLGMVGGLNDMAFDSKGETLALSYADGMTYVIDLHDSK